MKVGIIDDWLFLNLEGCSRVGVSGFNGSDSIYNGLYIQSSISLYITGNGSCGTTPVYTQHGSPLSNAVIITNLNVARGFGEVVYWAVLDDASRLIGLSLGDISAVFAGTKPIVPGLLGVFFDNSEFRTALSSLGPFLLVGSASDKGIVSLQCGLTDLDLLQSHSHSMSTWSNERRSNL
jgi:hypothetical protein